MSDHPGGGPAVSPAAPPATTRRPRVREVSSRFMSPLIQSNSTPHHISDLPRSNSVTRRRPLPSRASDENHAPEVNRSLDTPHAKFVLSTVHKKQQDKRVKPTHPKESSEVKDDVRVPSKQRGDTPIPAGTDRIVPSRYRQTPHRSNSLNSSTNSNSSGAISDATRLLSRISTNSSNKDDDSDTCSNQGSSSCPNSPLCSNQPISKTRSMTDIRSSMPDVDKWLNERNANGGKSGSDCARSLNFFSSSVRGGGGGQALPPHPSMCVRQGGEVRKGKKGASQQDDVHSLKMMYNHYLQWRLANAKAEVSAKAQKMEAERKLYSLGCKIAEIRDAVKQKRAEFLLLRQIKTVNTIVEDQMPYLDEWSGLEENYSTSLSGIANALLDCSVRLPVGSEVRVDPTELKEALNSAVKVVESIGSHIQRFFPKAEEMDTSLSELARMVGGERALIEECGDLLSRGHASQVIECSLRGTLIQLHHSQNQKV